MKDAESMERVFLKYYQTLEALVAKGGRWGTEM
jgi:hypothetical protein